jgi:hypothetical protein
MRIAWILGLALAVAVACGGSSFDGQVYRSGDIAFRIGPVPGSWHRIEATGALLAFRDDAAPATVALNGRCGLDGDDVPLEALTHHLFLQFTDRELVSQNRIDLDGREALRTEIIAELDGVKMHYVVYVLKKDGCVYDFVYVSPGAAAGEAAFERFVRGFGTLS